MPPGHLGYQFLAAILVLPLHLVGKNQTEASYNLTCKIPMYFPMGQG